MNNKTQIHDNGSLNGNVVKIATYHIGAKTKYDDPKNFKPRNAHQKEYAMSIDKNNITFGLGDAGVGKTYITVLKAVAWQKEDPKNRKIIVTRPVKPGAHDLGYYTGDEKEKMMNWVKPVMNKFDKFQSAKATASMIEEGQIILAPFATMVGETYDNAFMILDDAQDCTFDDLNMFLTRIGENSKAVVNGDPTQTRCTPAHNKGRDVHESMQSGLQEVADMMIAFKAQNTGVTRFDESDIERSASAKEMVRIFNAVKKTKQNNGHMPPAVQ